MLKRDEGGISVNHFLMIALAVSCILNFYFFYGYASVSSELRVYQTKIDEMNLLLKSLMEKLRGAVPYMVVEEVSLRFYPAVINRTAPKYSVVYISGYASVGNLRMIKVRPVDVVLRFEVETINSSDVSYDYYPKIYKISVAREETNYVECPFAIYPIYVGNKSVSFKVHVYVNVVWRGENVSSSATSAIFNIGVD